MSTTASSSGSKEYLLRKLTVWATKEELLYDPYLNNLIKDITEDRNLSFWAEQDPMNLIPPVDSKKGFGLIRLSRFFSILRNTLVFLPVALTWKAVSDATAGFAAFTSQSQATPVNFLEFWQNGYGYISPFWTISNVALVDFWIILLVIGITLLANTLNSNGQRIIEFNSQLLEKEKLAIVIDIKKYLYNVKPHKIENINQDVIGSIEKLNQGMREFNKASENIENLSNFLNKVIPQVQQVHESINEVAASNSVELEKVFINFTNELNKGLNALNTWVSDSQLSMRKMSEVLEDSISQYSKNTNEQIAKINRNVSDISIANSAELERVFGKFTKDLGTGMKELNNFILQLQSSVHQVHNLLDNLMASSVSNMTSDINSANKYISKSARMLESELDSLSSQINITAASLKAKYENQEKE